jgi:hypothetical protein
MHPFRVRNAATQLSDFRGEVTILGTQRALWRAQTRLLDRSPLNLAFGLLLDGPLALDALERALRGIVARHEPLRTEFGAAAGELSAGILPEARIDLTRVDLTSLAPELQDEYVRRECSRVAADCIDSAPLMRARCLLLEPDRHALLLNFNHIAVDGWSLEIFGREVETLYSAALANAASSLPPLPCPQLSGILEEEQRWRSGNLFSREIEQRRRDFRSLDMTAVAPFGMRAPFTYHMRRRVFPLSSTQLAGLQRSADRVSATLFAVLLAAVAKTLCHHLGLPEIVLGTLIANRNNALAHRLLGAHYSGTAVRIRVPSESAATEILQDVRLALLGAVGQRLDVDNIAYLLGEAVGAGEPLTPACHVVMDRFPLHRVALEDVTVHPIDSLLCASQANDADQDHVMQTCSSGDFVIFLRRFGTLAGLNIFWNPARVPTADSIIDGLLRELQSLATASEDRATPPSLEQPCLAAAGESTAVRPGSWIPAVPAVDALSPWPLLGVGPTD